ncbi:MAG: hypothetical protein GY816_17210 [Cytophagales bacterium]|nr:hypothetical protein [Cytophagales bacterium]
MKKILSITLILFLVMSSGCKLIYPNRVPVVKPKKHFGWYQPKFKKRKRTKVVWMKVHKGKFKNETSTSASPSPSISEAP